MHGAGRQEHRISLRSGWKVGGEPECRGLRWNEGGGVEVGSRYLSL
jgi:hypothetical protein